MNIKQRKQEKEYKFPYHYIPQFNTKFSQTRSLRWGYVYASYIEIIVGLLGKDYSPNSVVEIGCGDGRVLNEIAKRYPEMYCVGVDYSARAIGFARAFNPGMEFRVVDITSSPSGLKEFDVALLVETLEHIVPEKIDAFLSAISKHLAPEGKLIITVPHANKPTSPKHYQHFTKEKLEKIIAPYFIGEEYIHLNKRTFLGWFLQRLITNRFFSITHCGIQTAFYNFYKKYLLYASSQNAGRICVVCRKK